MAILRQLSGRGGVQVPKAKLGLRIGFTLRKPQHITFGMDGPAVFVRLRIFERDV